MMIVNRPKPRVNTGELRTPVTFYEYRPVKDSPYPDEKEYATVFECWAKVDRVWLKELEQAKSNGTISDVTLTIRDPMKEFIPDNKHFIKIDSFDYEHLVYNLTSSYPLFEIRAFITIVAQLKDDMKWQ